MVGRVRGPGGHGCPSCPSFLRGREGEKRGGDIRGGFRDIPPLPLDGSGAIRGPGRTGGPGQAGGGRPRFRPRFASVVPRTVGSTSELLVSRATC